MKRVAAIALLALTACTNPERKAPYTSTPVPEKDAGGFACSAEAAQYGVGQKASVELATELMKKTGSEIVRWIAPNTLVTLDYRSNRLNIYYNEKMVITQIDCG